MIKFHVGVKGSGKTKKLIDAVNAAVGTEKGNVVCITNGTRLIHDLDRAVRMINTESFNINGFDMFEGFLCGIISENFDITHIFIDSIFKCVDANLEGLDGFVSVLEKLNEQFGVCFTIMVSADENSITPNVKKYVL